MVNVNDLKNGTVIEYDGKLCQIIEFMHVLQNICYLSNAFLMVVNTRKVF